MEQVEGCFVTRHTLFGCANRAMITAGYPVSNKSSLCLYLYTQKPEQCLVLVPFIVQVIMEGLSAAFLGKEMRKEWTRSCAFWSRNLPPPNLYHVKTTLLLKWQRQKCRFGEQLWVTRKLAFQLLTLEVLLQRAILSFSTLQIMFVFHILGFMRLFLMVASVHYGDNMAASMHLIPRTPPVWMPFCHFCNEPLHVQARNTPLPPVWKMSAPSA